MERAYVDGPAVAVEIAGTRPGRRKARASRHRSGELALNSSARVGQSTPGVDSVAPAPGRRPHEKETDIAGNFIASSTITIRASADRVWSVLTDPQAIKEFMFGTEVVTDWTVGGTIVWRGVWKGKEYEDKGVILEFEPGKQLVNTHFSPLSGQDDAPENYHTLTWTLTPEDGMTRLTLSQDNNASTDEAAHSKGMWDSLLQSVKNISERS